MDYKEMVKSLLNCKDITEKQKEKLLEVFSEVNESYDERIRKEILEHIKLCTESIPDRDKYIAWLEKQSEQKVFYIRFGDIPSNEKSKIYNGEEEVGVEGGVSVYPAFVDNKGNVTIGLALPITKTTLYTQQHLLEYDNRPCYLVTGDYVGIDLDGQSLIKNVSIIKEIKNYRIKEEKQVRRNLL